MTKHGETDGYGASDFIREINRYLGGNVLDCAVLNYYEYLPRDVYLRYHQEHAEPVAIDLAACYQLVSRLLIEPLTLTSTLVRHDPDRLAMTLIEAVRLEGSETSVLEEVG
jgi:2-phospho-L-lactate transferase/gluconeogenesis factor (CofD/UPF0052 family)